MRTWLLRPRPQRTGNVAVGAGQRGLMIRVMKVIADYDLCESNGFCERVAPEVFHVDEKDEMWIQRDGEVPPELEDKVREAVRICPRMALSLDEG